MAIIVVFTILSAFSVYASYRTRKMMFLIVMPVLSLFSTFISILIRSYQWSQIPYSVDVRSAPDYAYGIADSWQFIFSLLIVLLISLLSCAILRNSKNKLK